MTVKDISGPSSFALARRCRAVTTNSRTAPITQQKLFAQIVFHPITNCAALTCSLLSPSRQALSGCGGQTEGRRRRWWEWTGGCVLQKLPEWRLSLSSLLLFQKLQTMCIDSKPVLLTFPAVIVFCLYFFFFWSASFFGLNPFLNFYPTLSFALTAVGVSPVHPPRWPLQGYKLSESKLYREQIMEHGTFPEKSNTQSPRI